MFDYARDAISSVLFHTPMNVRLWLTQRCNYRCEMCSAVQDSNGPEMDLDALRGAFRNLKKTRVRQVVLTGGEPTLRADIVDIVEACASAGFRVRMQTNGGPQVTEALLDRCYDKGLSDLSVSLDTLDPSLQDEICKARGVVSSALRVLKHAAARHGHRGVVSANVVMSALNFQELPSIIRATRQLGIFFGPCIYTRSFTSDTFQGAPADRFDLRSIPADVRESVFDQMLELYDQDYPIITASRTLRAMRDFMRSGSMAWPCRAGELSFDVLPSGELAPCCEKTASARQAPVANIRRDDFLAVYQSREFRDKCRTAREACPGCLYACYRDPAYLRYDPRTQVETLSKTVRYGKWAS
ncbi:MAG: radical SAM protein [Deltaproteobacteria bacterium]|nr:radical SAM protein [Deltaproteobacteria bacterium]